MLLFRVLPTVFLISVVLALGPRIIEDILRFQEARGTQKINDKRVENIRENIDDLKKEIERLENPFQYLQEQRRRDANFALDQDEKLIRIYYKSEGIDKSKPFNRDDSIFFNVKD